MKPNLLDPQPADLFDFWLGEWELSWTNANGTRGTGRNRVVRILDGAVIEENFEAIDGPPPRLKGRSLSVLHQGSKLWKQTWADSQGGYFALTARIDGDRRIFQTETVVRNGKEVAQRMVFHSIQKNAFVWDWEATTDGGKTWKQQWQIEYKRHR